MHMYVVSRLRQQLPPPQCDRLSQLLQSQLVETEDSQSQYVETVNDKMSHL